MEVEGTWNFLVHGLCLLLWEDNKKEKIKISKYCFWGIGLIGLID
jgi:uncharacterized membrane protein